LVENLNRFIWDEVSKKYVNLKSYIVKGDNDKKRVYSNSGKNYIDESVDLHCYINDIFVLAIECKTYLDKPYLQRANDDFRLMRKSTEIKNTVVFSIEDSIATNSLEFFLEEENGVDKVFFIADGKRNSLSKRRIYREESWKRINETLIENYINFIKGIFDEYSS
jgi:hypothetical protein